MEIWNTLPAFGKLYERCRDNSITVRNIRSKHVNVFDNTNNFCQYSHDTLVMNFGDGFGPHVYLRIKVAGERYNLNLRKSDCLYSYDCNVISESVRLLQIRSRNGDSLILKVNYKGWGRDSVRKTIYDTLLIEGCMRIAIRPKGYTWDNLQFENDSMAMVQQLAVKDPQNITSITFIRCGLKDFPIELKGFKNLESLRLDMNDLSKANFEILKSLKKLKYIQLDYCSLSEFPSVLLSLESLVYINLASNKITSVPNEVYKMRKLEDLNLSFNKKLDSSQVYKNNGGRIKITNLDWEK
jgi:hypothetical protein